MQAGQRCPAVDRYLEPASVARRAGFLLRWDLGRCRLGSFRVSGRVPIGVVKLLRARGGCLGVIRWWAWEAAKSSGELPNEH